MPAKRGTAFLADITGTFRGQLKEYGYHHKSGFQIPQELLEHLRRYISLDHLLLFDVLTFEIYRITVGSIILEGVQIAIAARKQQIGKETTGFRPEQIPIACRSCRRQTRVWRKTGGQNLRVGFEKAGPAGSASKSS